MRTNKQTVEKNVANGWKIENGTNLKCVQCMTLQFDEKKSNNNTVHDESH